MHPVEQISWYEALEFCDRLTVYTSRQYRLPTEAEWEYACRASTVTPFHFGDTVSTDYANYNGADEEYGAYGLGIRGENRGKTTPVDQFEGANAFGLCDMHGNVWEWCQDYWHENYDDAPTNGRAWLEDGTSSLRILRGGSWIDHPHNCRSASRKRDTPDRRGYSFGFRVCCSAFRTQKLSGMTASVQVSADAASFKVPNPESYNLPLIE
jgi:formylglycine-generating enzyme required for sulfatase activity